MKGFFNLRGTDTTETTLACYVKTYTYDLAGNRTGFTLTKDGETVHNIVYQYDALNRLTDVSDFGEVEAAYTYDVNGNRASLTYANGAVTTYSYNKANWVTDLTNTSGGSVLSSYRYTYYASGNQRSKTDSDGVVTTYVYDDLGRLVQEAETDGLTVDYTYDAAGNRIQMAVSGTETYTTSYTYDANNRLTQEVKTGAVSNEITVYTYDPNGNLLQKSNPNGAEFYQYNGFNQLFIVSCGSSSTVYAYNAQGIRTAKVTDDSATTFLLDGGDVIGEVEDGILTTTYLRDVNLIRRIGAEGMEYYLFNAHGDVVGLTDGFGAFVKSYDYDAFGNEKNPDESDTNPFRYCGEYFDKETGTYYLRARYYDPAIGRFTQEDTHWSPANMIYGDNPRKIYERQDALGLSTCTYAPEISAIMQSGNLYVYCVNNPALYADPSGNFVISTAALLAIGGFVIFGTIGGLIGNYIADENGATGWEKAGYIAGGVVVLGAAGAAGGYYLAPAVVSATGVGGISVTTAGINVVTASGAIYYSTLEQGVNFAHRALERMNNPARFVPVQSLIDAIKYGSPMPDTQGSRAIMYTIEFVKNGTDYTLEVLYDKATNSIWHFMYFR